LEQKNYKDFLTIGKQTESQSLEFFRLVDHFMERVNEAKRFKPNDSQKKLYEDVKGLIYKDMKVISLYIAYKNDKYNRTDLQRVKTYQLIMINDLEGYMAESMITEKEFDKSFNFLLSNWEKLTNELRREFN